MSRTTNWKDRPLLLGQSQLTANVHAALRVAIRQLQEHATSESDLAERMRVSAWTLRKILRYYRLAALVKNHGGRRYLRFELTPEVFDEICRDGVPSVARRLNVSPSAVYRRLKQLTESDIERLRTEGAREA